MKFNYDDIRSGNATCTFEINDKKMEFYPSFHSDALGDFVTYTGPVLLCWEFKRNFEDLEITITEKQNVTLKSLYYA